MTISEQLGLSSTPKSVWLLILANCAPLTGVLIYDYTIFNLLLAYWAETAVIGIYTLCKMLIVSPPTGTVYSFLRFAGRFPLMVFFTFHFGGFMMGHALFIFALFAADSVPKNIDTLVSNVAYMLPVLISFTISHGYSFYTNFIKSGEFRRGSVQQLMFQPYPRVIVMHITIIIGAFLMMALGTHVALLLVLITLKTIVDVYAHLKERKKFSTGTQTTA